MVFVEPCVEPLSVLNHWHSDWIQGKYRFIFIFEFSLHDLTVSSPFPFALSLWSPRSSHEFWIGLLFPPYFILFVFYLRNRDNTNTFFLLKFLLTVMLTNTNYQDKLLKCINDAHVSISND